MPGEIFATGWNHLTAAAARQAMLQSGRYAVVRVGVDVPPAFSLSQFRLRHLEQGRAGTCWLHSVTQLIETLMGARRYGQFPVCRRLIGRAGSRWPSGGGNPTTAIQVCTNPASGKDAYGFAHEELCPYSDDASTLASWPDEKTIADGKNQWMTAPVDVQSDDDARALIYHGSGVANGMPWTSYWDSRDVWGFEDGKTGFGGGHSLTEMGYVMKGVWPGQYGQYDWWQLDNWHTELYAHLPDELANKVPGYKPTGATRTSDFWMRGDLYTWARSGAYAERVSATDAEGLKKVCDLHYVLTHPLRNWKAGR